MLFHRKSFEVELYIHAPRLPWSRPTSWFVAGDGSESVWWNLEEFARRYEPVDDEAKEKWKEMYGEEYDNLCGM